MKYKILLNGQNRAVVDDFFSHMGEYFECLCTSSRSEDIINHIAYFHPDAFVCCLHKEVEVLTSKIDAVAATLKQENIPLIIIGSQEGCDEYAKLSNTPIDLVITKPFTATVIREKLCKHLEIRKEKLEEEARKRELAEQAKYLEEETARLKKEQEEEQKLEEERKLEAAKKLAEIRKQGELRRQAEAQKKETVNTASTSRKHILVVDDDPTMLKAIRKHLGDHYDVATAISGKLALKFLESKTTDLVLLDYEMPGEKGTDVLEKMRANPLTSKIPVVFLTGISERAKIQKVISMKPRGYLLKPINHDILISTLHEILG